MKARVLLLLLLPLVMAAGCRKHPDSITADATVIDDTATFDNCGAYMVVIGEGVGATWYKPENLSKEFREDNLKVKIVYSITDKTHNCGFGGYVPVITIHRIKKI